MAKKAKPDETQTETEVIEHSEVANSERPAEVIPTSDEALNEVLAEPTAGASDTEIDIESTAGEDKEVEESAKPVKKAAKVAKKEHVQGPRHFPHGKKYKNAVAEIDLEQQYSKTDAIMLVKKTSYAKFDATVEAHVKVNADNIRGVVHLPSGTGKTKRIAVFAGPDLDEMIKKVEAGTVDFDIALATPESMPKLSKVAKILGPRGLMPNPKSGTVTTDIEKAKAEFASGRVEYKQDKGKVIHQAIGKVSMTDEQLLTNLDVLLNALPQTKITNISLSSTMGPGIKVLR